MSRNKITYGLFAGAGALLVLALTVLPRRTASPPVPPPPLVNPPPPTPPPPDPPPTPIVNSQPDRPSIDVVFALDTTGSMSGLIDGAKRKIWSIADFISSGQPQPHVRIGLVAYRDIGDDYVTRFYDLSDDLDAVFQHLSSFHADGGGDTPEHVAKALHDAVVRPSWSTGDKVVKIVYLVGDAPPHTDYHDGYDYRAISRKAAALGIHINAIRCGSDPDTAVAWREISRLGHGDYASIEQSGGVATVATPYDDKLAELNRKLTGTTLAWGSEHRRSEVMSKMHASTAAPATIAADRAGFAARNKMAISGDGDLLNDVAAGKAKLGAIRKDELPMEMQALAPAAQSAYVAQKAAERERIIDEIKNVSAARGAYMKKAAKPSAFDDHVRKSIAEDAAGVSAY